MIPSDVAMVLPTLFEANLPVLLKGQPGCAKTDLVKQAVANMPEVTLIHEKLKGRNQGRYGKTVAWESIISHPVVDDPTDYKGMPWANDDGYAEFKPFGNLRKMLEATAPTVYFMDDLGQASPAVQAAAMQLLLAREINGKKVPDCVRFIAATNRKGDRAGVTGILEPVKSRFATIINVDVHVGNWLKWYKKQPDCHDGLHLFVSIRRDQVLCNWQPSADITNSPSPRTVYNASKLLSMDFPKVLKQELVQGAAGEGFAAELFGFLENIDSFAKLPTIMNDPHFVCPPEPATRFALAGFLASKATVNNLGTIASAATKLPKEFEVITWKAALERKPELTQTTEYVMWASANATYLS